MFIIISYSLSGCEAEMKAKPEFMPTEEWEVSEVCERGPRFVDKGINNMLLHLHPKKEFDLHLGGSDMRFMDIQPESRLSSIKLEEASSFHDFARVVGTFQQYTLLDLWAYNPDGDDIFFRDEETLSCPAGYDLALVLTKDLKKVLHDWQ